MSSREKTFDFLGLWPIFFRFKNEIKVENLEISIEWFKKMVDFSIEYSAHKLPGDFKVSFRCTKNAL